MTTKKNDIAELLRALFTFRLFKLMPDSYFIRGKNKTHTHKLGGDKEMNSHILLSICYKRCDVVWCDTKVGDRIQVV